MRKFWPFLLTLLALALVSPGAFADAGAAVATAQPLPPQLLWGLVAAVVAQAATFTLKRASSWYFFHTAFGSIVLAFLSGALGTLGPVIQTKGLDKYALLFAVLNFALNFFTTGNATNPIAVEAVKARLARSTPGGSVGLAKQSALLGLGVVLFLGLGGATKGCTPGAQVLGVCELGKLPQILQAAVVAVVQIAADPSKTADDFLTAGKDLAPGQLDCVVAAVSTALKAKVPSHGQADPLLLSMIEKLDAYSAKHPAKACGDLERL